MKENKKNNLILRIITGAISVALMVVIFFFSSQQGGPSNNTSITFISLLFGDGADFARIMNALVREFAHMAEFAALAVPLYLFMRTYRISGFLQCSFSTIIASFYAFTDEFHQLFVPGRSGQFYDVFIDVLGVMLSVLVLHSLFYFGKKREIKKQFRRLSKSDEIVLNAFSSYITNRNCEFNIDDDLFNLCVNKSFEHKISPIVFSAFNKNGITGVAENNIFNFKSDALMRIASQIKKNASFIDVCERLSDKGIVAVCVKGPLCAMYYKNPEMRISGDFDILVNEKDYETAVGILKENGFFGKSTDKYDNDFYNYETCCNIELHRFLFPNDNSFYNKFNGLLEPLWENVTEVNCFGKKFYTLNQNYHILYLFLHAFKHFIVAGVGIRQVCDISLFAKNNDIDWEFVFDRLKNVNLQGFANGILLLGEKYFDLDISYIAENVKDFNVKLDTKPLLCDIMSGGIYGGEGAERHHSGNITFSAYNRNLNEDARKFTGLFPPREAMKKKYPDMKDSNFSLIIFWIKRIIKYFMMGGSSSQIIDLGSKRKAILKEYGIIE